MIRFAQFPDSKDVKVNFFANLFDGALFAFGMSFVSLVAVMPVLVKKLGVRIEMRQVGIRNQAKMCGGIGRCGREICCSGFIEKFGPVSIRMAKEQGLSLNPTKISGQCGRLMCCLTFEYDTYQALRAQLPKIGKMVKTKSVTGKVIRHNPICSRVAVRLDNDQEVEIGLNEILNKDAQD